MKEKQVANRPSEPDFQGWALRLIVVPFILLMLTIFLVAPLLWGRWVAAKFGSYIGFIFIIYLFFIILAATLWKIFCEVVHWVKRKS